MNKKELSKYWDAKWSDYTEQEPNAFAKKLVEMYARSDKKDLLDLGCGDGRDTRYFIKNGFNVSCIDIASKSIEKIKQEFGNKVNATCQDIQNLQFSNESFDIIYSHLTLHYFNDEDTTKAFDKIYNLLRKGGIFFVKCKSDKDRLCNDSQGEKIAENIYFKGHVRHFFSLDYLKSKLNKFDIIEIEEEEHAKYNGWDSSFVYAVVKK